MSQSSIECSNSSVSLPFRGASLAIVAAIFIQAFRIFTVTTNGETPFLSANDRSRWCTIASLIEDRSFVIDRFLDIRDSKGKTRTWYSIDMVRKPEADGSEHYYSSKPPLLSVIYATICSPLSVLLNRRLSDDPMVVGRSLLLIVNLVPIGLFWFAFANWIRRSVDDFWARWILLSMVLFGTFLSTFTNTINNHFPAAFFLMASLWCLECLLARPRNDIGPVAPYFLLGFFAALTAACELPALAWLCAVIGLVALRIGIKAAMFTMTGSLPIGMAFAITNFIAYGDLQPPYAHREVLGPQLAMLQSSSMNAIDAPPSIAELEKVVSEAKLPIAGPYSVRSARRSHTWELSGYNPLQVVQSKRFAVVPTGSGWSIHRWNDWYDYPKSYWLPENKRGVDLGEPSPVKYALHVLVGHHGIFSLTPFWFLSLIGAILVLKNNNLNERWWLTIAICAVSVVCIVFYLMRPLIDRNYGGVCSGFRWIFWLAPAWLWLAAPGLEAVCRSKWGRGLAILLTGISIFSATYPWANPWQHPWPYVWLIQ